MLAEDISLVVLLTATLFVNQVQLVYSEPREDTWLKAGISSIPVYHFENGQSQMTVYEHVKNSERPVTEQKFYFAPLCELISNTATSAWNPLTLQFEMTFEIRLWDRAVQEAVLDYLRNNIEGPLKLHQVQALPVEIMALRCVGCREFGLHSNTRRATTLSPGRARLTLACPTAKRCDELAEQLKTRPELFDNFSLIFGFQNQQSQTRKFAIHSNIISQGAFYRQLKQEFPNQSAVYITPADEKLLITQSIDLVLAQHKSEWIFPASHFHTTELLAFLNGFLVEERRVTSKFSAQTWEEVFWDQSDVPRPDKLAKHIQEVYDSKLIPEILKSFLERLFHADNKLRSWPSMLEEFEAELTSKRTVRGFDKHDIVQNELDNAFQMKRAVDYLRKSRQHLVYTGKLFTVKPDVFTKINLDHIPTLIDLNMEYYIAVFNIPLKVQRDNPSADTVTSIAQELMELKTIMLEARASADKQRSDAGHLLTQEVRKVMLEIEANSTRKLQEVFAEAANKQKILDDPTHVIPGSAQCGSMQKYIENMLLEIVNVTNKTGKINLCPGPLIETKVFRNRPVMDLQRQFLLEDSCHDIRRKQAACKSGMYIIQPPLLGNGQCRRIVCDMEFEGGGWTEFQTRGDYFPVEAFHRPWVDFKSGFGDFDREYWLGNELLWALTNSDKTTVYELYIEMEDWDGNKRFARYNSFRVGSEAEGFPLYFRGESYKGNAGNSLAYHNASRFSSYDKDNDNHSASNCANQYKGGWWFNSCVTVNLNGVHLRGVHKALSEGIMWKDWLGINYSLKSSRMMFRPENFTDILNSSNQGSNTP